MGPRRFTVPEANKAIPRIAKLIEDLQEKLGWLNKNRQPVSYVVEQYKIVNESPVDADYFKALLRVRRSLKEIHDSGAQVKDIQSGLVDFPSRLFGKDVLLCWKMGEDEIRFWHDLETGFSGRQPLPEAGTKPDAEGQGN
jgi:hypothetical protein